MTATAEHSSVTRNPLADAYARWRSTVEAELKGASFDKKLVTRTLDGLALQPLYTRENLANVRDLDATPGTAPYLRGVRPLGYKTRGWEVAQTLTVATAREFNATLRPELMKGLNAVVLTADEATRVGCDPDEATANEVGAGGVSLVDVEDVVNALSGIELSAVPLHLQAGVDPLPLAALYLEALRRRGTDLNTLTGSVTADPIGEWITRGELPASLDTVYDSLAVWTAWAETHAPELRTVAVDATRWGNAGGTTTQELAFALATAVEYLRALSQRGVGCAAMAKRMTFSFATGPQFFAEIAKLRAFRPLWTRVVAAFGAAPEAAAAATISAATGDWNKSLLDPHVNMLRVTTEGLSAVLGGCDRLNIAPFDNVSGATNEFSRRISRNLHTLLAEEFNFAETADPAGGSWYVEKLTDDLARAAWMLFQDIEGRGGMAAALRAGYPQQLVAKAAAEKRDAVAKRRLGVVGVNLFPNLKETPLAKVSIDAAARQSRRVLEVRLRRGGPPAGGVETVDPSSRFATMLKAAREGATIGQLSRLGRGVNAPRETIARVISCRAAEDFERLRSAAAAFARRTGARPRVFLAKMGPALQHKARADFSAGFFAAGGFETMAKQSFATAEEAAVAAIASRAPVVVLCSTDETYPMLAPVFAAEVRANSPDTTIVLAGLPADAAMVAVYRMAGIDEFIHLRASVSDVLAYFLKKMGAL